MLLFSGGLVCEMHLFLLGFMILEIVLHTLNAMRSMSLACECTHGEQGVNCEFVTVVGVSRDTSVLY